MTCVNDASPLLLPWTNVSISGDEVQRGIRFGFGSPQQAISMRPMTSQSHIALFNSTGCTGDNSTTSCVGVRGGLFDGNESSTFSPTSITSWNGSIWTVSQSVPYEYFYDDVYLDDHMLLGDLPLVFRPPRAGRQSTVGIGTNSTFLDAIINKQAAPTRNWGLWAGSRSVSAPADGALWVGGYDSDRVVGDFTAFRSTTICDACTAVVNMTYTTQNASTQLYYVDPLVSPITFLIELNPTWDNLAVPPDIFALFQQAVGGNLTNDSATTGIMTVPSDADLGDLTVTLRGGYSSVIPARELFLPPRNFTSNGTYTITNDSYLISTIVNQTVPSASSLSWGLPFFAMNYMILDLDNQVFKLAEARQGPSTEGSSSSIIPLCASASSTNGAGAVPIATSTPTPAPRAKSNVGPIVGGTIGGIVGLFLLCLLAWMLVRRKKKQQDLRQEKYQVVPTEWETASLQKTTHPQTETLPHQPFRVIEPHRADFQSLLHTS